MDFEFTSEENAFRDELRQWLKAELSASPDSSGGSSQSLNYGTTDKEWDFNMSMRGKLAEKGWLTMAWPEEYGGQDASAIKQMIFSEEMAYHRAPGRDNFATRMLAPTLMIHGTDEQRSEFLPPIAKGGVQWCQGYSEPESGSDLASLQTKAVEDGDDFIVNGTKIWTSMAHRADHIFLMARTDPDAPKHRGISFLLCDMDDPGITVSPIINMAGAHHFNMVTFDNVRIPKKNLVGELNRGWYVGATLLDFERSGVDYPAEGKRMLEDLIDFAKNNTKNGLPISEDPVIKEKLANLAIEVEVCKLISYNVAWMQSQGLVPNKEASMAKIRGSELQQHLSEFGMMLLGMHGQLEGGSKYAPFEGRILHQHLMNTSLTILAGTTEIQKGIIATRGLGLPRG